MSYSDSKYYSRELAPVTLATNVGTSTATASGHVVTLTSCALLPKVFRRTQITNIRVHTDTACGAGTTTPTLNFLNGTSTFATVAVAAVGTGANATMTVANEIVAVGVAPTVNFVGTATASANTAAGLYSIYFETQELYA